MSFISLFMMLFAGGGAGNDLLDFVPTKSYFEAAKIEMNVAALTAVLEAAEPEVPEAMPGDAARRQMALRGLGELKDVSALATVERYLRSPNPLTADYAKAAVAALKGEEFERARPREDALRGDLACLPSGLGAIGRINASSGAPMNLKELMGAGGMPGGMDLEQMEAQIVEGVGQVIAMVGNFRISALTFGVSSSVGPDEGYMVMVARGLYDHSALERALGGRVDGVRMKKGGLVYHELESDNIYVAPVSDELLVFFAGATRAGMPLEEVGAKALAGGGDFAIGKDLAKLLERTDTSTPLWAMATVTESYKQAPFLKPFDTLVLGSELVGEGKSKLVLKANGTDAEGAKAIADEMEAGLASTLEQMEQMGEEEKAFPGATEMLDLMKSVKIAAEGGSAELSVEMSGSSAMSMLPMLFFGKASMNMEVVEPEDLVVPEVVEEEAAE